MIDFGWMRLAYLLIVLSVLGALVQLGTPTAAPRPLAAEPPDERIATEDPPAHEAPSPRTVPRENPAARAFARHLHGATGASRGASETDRAVFYSPAPKNSKDAGAPSRPGPVCGDLGRFPSGHRLVFPLPMRYAHSFEDTWGAPRPQGGHEGTDLMSPTGTPEYAVTDGTIVPVTGSNGNGWNTLGGYTVMLRAAYSVGPVREGDLFYYAHLNRESALPLGTAVRAGKVVGYVGDTGQGPQVTRGLFPPHLHFGWYDATGTRSYLPSGAMNPYPLLEWMAATGGTLNGGSNARYCEVPRSGPPTPSRGPDRWPTASDADARPDLDTGTGRPAPVPVARERAPAHEPPSNSDDSPDRTHKPSPAKVPANASPGARAKAVPEPAPRAPKPSNPGEPPARNEHSPPAAPPETGHGPAAGESAGEDPRAPDSSDNESPHGGNGHPGTQEGSQDNQETGKAEDPDKEPPGDAEEQNPREPQAGDDEPAGENPDDGTTRPGEETTPDDPASETGEPSADEDTETAAPETDDPGSEPPPGTTSATPEATTTE